MAQSDPNAPASLPISEALQQAVTHHKAGALQDAERLYRAILQIQPNHPDANHNLGVLAVQVKQPIVGLSHFKTALEVNPNQSQYWLSYIDALLQTNQHGAAHRIVEQSRQHGLQAEVIQALEYKLKRAHPPSQPSGTSQQQPDKAPSTPSTKSNQRRKIPEPKLFRKGKSPKHTAGRSAQEINTLTILFTEGRYAEAEALAEAMTLRFPDFGFGWKVLGAARKQQGRLSEALFPLQRATALLPDDAGAYRNLGNAYLDQGRIADAETCHRQAVALKPDYAKAHSNLGAALQRQGRVSEAELSYRRALEINSNIAEAHANLASVLQEQGRLFEAVVSYRRALEITPDFPEAHTNLGTALQKLGQHAEAEACYRRALAIDPAFVEAHINLGANFQEQKRLSDAIACYRRVLELKPDFAEAYNNLGSVLSDIGDLDQAIIALRKAVQYQPSMAQAYKSLGQALLFLDREDEEVHAYQTALDVDSTNVGLEAAVWLAIRHYLAGDSDLCRNMLAISQPLMSTTDAKYEASRIYWAYLDKLVRWHQQAGDDRFGRKDMETLQVIGESHSLATQGVVVSYRRRKMCCTAHWIPGCKQWHLGNNNANKYKRKFEAVMERLPRQSTILLTIGEIDCRPRGGIITAWEKAQGKSLNDVARSTIEGYVRYVSEAGTRYGHQLIVSGVPATNFQLAALTQKAGETLVGLIRTFNAILKHQVLEAGMDFLDLYALTNRGDGIASGESHIDNYHLLPNAVAKAFDLSGA